MKFTKEQQDFLKHCGEHFEVLTGGRGHSKTKEVIEDLQQELERYKNIIDEIERYFIDMFNRTQDTKYLDDLQKLKELKGE